MKFQKPQLWKFWFTSVGSSNSISEEEKIGGREKSTEKERETGHKIPARRDFWFCIYLYFCCSSIPNNPSGWFSLQERVIWWIHLRAAFRSFMSNFIINIAYWKSNYFKSRKSYMCVLCINEKRVLWVFIPLHLTTVAETLLAMKM